MPIMYPYLYRVRYDQKSITGSLDQGSASRQAFYYEVISLSQEGVLGRGKQGFQVKKR